MTLLLHPPGTLPRSGTYTLHPDHCAVELSLRQLTRTVRARVTPLDGELHIDAEDPAASSVWIDLDAASLTTGNPDRDEVVTGPELLDTDRFPFLRFESRSVAGSGAERWTVRGDLYVRDLVGEVDLDVRRLDTPDDRIALVASTCLQRSTFGLRWSERFERLGLLVGDTVKVRLGVEFGR
jgi:polyisoprenoid-binding protein YceI